MGTVLVTGGCGYIGSHTVVELIEAGYDVVSVDSYVRSSPEPLDGIKRITGRSVQNVAVDLCDLEATRGVFATIGPIDAVIHFAAFKSVPESVEQPLLYYRNNIVSLLNVLQCVEEFDVGRFVFSSSCAAYGNVAEHPVTETTPLARAESPYAYTKQIGERIVEDLSRNSRSRFISLRYFNPVGAHVSGLIGETPLGQPQNLTPAITQAAIGKRGDLVVYGDDYPTRDGTCIRDYVHVSDIAAAHVRALGFLAADAPAYSVVNLGSGTGVSVREMIDAFERVSGQKLPVRIGPRRPGDIESIVADNSLAGALLGWRPRYDVEDMMRSAWRWELALRDRE